MFQILSTEDKIEYKDILDVKPTVRIRLKDKLSINGYKYSYDDLTQVVVEGKQSKLIATPKIFSDKADSPKAKIVDYAPVYIIGMLEIFNLSVVGLPRLSELLVNSLGDELSLFESYTEVEKFRKKFMDIEYVNEPIYNLLHLMRTDYNTQSYKIVMDFVPLLMLCYEVDKKKFCQIFFEIMNYSVTYLTDLFPDLLKKKSNSFQAKNNGNFVEQMKSLIANTAPRYDAYWLNDTDDLHLHYLSYKNPTTGKRNHITDCRGFAIAQSFKLYSYFLVQFGEVLSSKEPLFDYKNEQLIPELTKLAKQCVGDDYQSDVLAGDVLPLVVSDRGSFVVENQKKYVYYADESRTVRMKTPKIFYEDLFLFRKAYNAKIKSLAEMSDKDRVKQHTRNYSTNYVRYRDMLNAVAQITQYSEDLQTEVEINKIKKLEEENGTLKSNLSTIKTKVQQMEKLVTELKEVKATTDNVTDLTNEIEQLKSLLASKSQIIEQQTDEIVELNKKISKMYSEDEQKKIAEEESISQEEKVKALNDFSFYFVGEFMDVVEKCREKGWTNVSHLNNTNILNSTAKSVDFIILFTSFTSHHLVRCVENRYNNMGDRTFYYKGLNVDILIDTAYEFMQGYFNS